MASISSTHIEWSLGHYHGRVTHPSYQHRLCGHDPRTSNITENTTIPLNYYRMASPPSGVPFTSLYLSLSPPPPLLLSISPPPFISPSPPPLFLSLSLSLSLSDGFPCRTHNNVFCSNRYHLFSYQTCPLRYVPV